MHKLMEYVCDEMKDLEHKVEKEGKLSMQEVEYLDKLAHIKKDLLSADEMWDQSEYSMADGRMMRGGMMDHSYARKRDAMGRYSRRADDDFKAELEELMHMAPNDHARTKIRQLMSEM